MQGVPVQGQPLLKSHTELIHLHICRVLVGNTDAISSFGHILSGLQAFVFANDSLCERSPHRRCVLQH